MAIVDSTRCRISNATSSLTKLVARAAFQARTIKTEKTMTVGSHDRGHGKLSLGWSASKSERQQKIMTRNGKGCDIGYALAVRSCEGADSVETCTVTALDAITAFAVPNPNCSSQESVGFFGSGRSSGYPSERITQPTSDRQRFIFANPFSHRRVPP